MGGCGAGDWDEETQREASKDRKFHMELVYAEGYFKSSVYLTAEWGEDVSLPRPNNSQRSGSEHCALWAHYTIALENRMLIHTPEGLFSQALGLDLHVNHMAAAIWHTAIPDDEKPVGHGGGSVSQVLSMGAWRSALCSPAPMEKTNPSTGEVDRQIARLVGQLR